MIEPSRRVLIAMANAGGGHRAVSAALAEALERRHRAEVRVVDLVALEPASVPGRLVRMYPWVMRHAPLLNGIAYHSTNRRIVFQALSRRSARRLSHHASRVLEEWQPAVVATAHPFCNRIVLDALDRSGQPIPVLAAVTELVSVHVSWADARLAGYAVATEDARAAVLALGADPARVELTGLPLGLEFGRVATSPAELRAELGLAPERFTVLLVGGGEGAGRLANQVRALDDSDIPLQMIVVCGHNERMRERLTRTPPRKPAAVLGFVGTMPHLMRAADVVVTKGGPTTLAEALVSARPVVVTSVLPGQEEGNDRFVERHGVGFGARGSAALVEVLGRLAADAALRERMQARAAALLPPGAAFRVADYVVGWARRAGAWEGAASLEGAR